MPSDNIENNQKNASLLILGDSSDTTLMIKLHFVHQQYEVVVLPWQTEPVDIFNQQNFHLILFIVTEASLNQSFDTIRQFRNNEQVKHLPIIYIDSLEIYDRITRMTALGLGVEDYLREPLDVEELRLRIKNKINFAQRQRPIPAAQAKILIVEDDFDISNMLRIFFTGQGYEVDVAARGADGLEKCRLMRPDLLILDIMLPDMNGYEICRRMRSSPNLNHIPILFLTQKDERSDKIKGLELGADDYITKPFDIEELSFKIKSMIDNVYTGQSSSLSNQNGPSQKSISTIELRNILRTNFNLAELHELCFDLGVSHEDFADQTKKGLARELVAYFERRNDLDRLTILCKKLRPKVFM